MDWIIGMTGEEYRQVIGYVREMSPGFKLFLGPMLFDVECQIIMDGLRSRFPTESEVELQSRLRELLDRQRREEGGE